MSTWVSRRGVAALLLLWGAAAAGQVETSYDDVKQHTFPPEMLMRYQEEISLAAEQAAAIKEETHKAQLAFLDLQWQQQAELEKLLKLLEGAHVDEAKALAQAERVMAAEGKIKLLHLSLLLRVKNLLTEAQQAKLAEIRRLLARDRGDAH